MSYTKSDKYLTGHLHLDALFHSVSNSFNQAPVKYFANIRASPDEIKSNAPYKAR